MGVDVDESATGGVADAQGLPGDLGHARGGDLALDSDGSGVLVRLGVAELQPLA